tara:strand:+ start:5062 stop:6375 length:1314 start_codon:yes stop_codon:yes gene_type:complete
MLSQKLLIIDDDETIIFSFKTFLNENNYMIEFCKNGKEGLEKLTTFKPDLVIADYKMPEMTGLEFIKAAKIIQPLTPIIIMSAYGDTGTKKIFYDEGAFEYIEKPFDIEEILKIIKFALEKNQNPEVIKSETFIGESSIVAKLFDKIEKIKTTDVTVLIEGESGTGKDLIATYVHNHSKVAKGPFVSINCAAIPENLIESELFGYEKGAFTGADEQKIGKFESAKNGTLFLDEIGELPLTIQAKLLRVLQNKTIERIGGTKSIQVNARIIAATNKSLHEMISQGSFREDLYYRLTSFPITVPPLRKRGQDILIIADYLLKKYCKEFNKQEKQILPDGKKVLENYDWPGNVRELQNIISRITLLEPKSAISKDEIIPYFPNESHKKNDLQFEFLAEFTEKELLKIHANETFKICNFNKSETAKKLGINYRTLIKRLDD